MNAGALVARLHRIDVRPTPLLCLSRCSPVAPSTGPGLPRATLWAVPTRVQRSRADRRAASRRRLRSVLASGPAAQVAPAPPPAAAWSRHYCQQVGRSSPALSALSVRDLRETAQALRKLANDPLPELSRNDTRLRERLAFAADVLDSASRARGSGTSRAVVDAAAWSTDRSSR